MKTGEHRFFNRSCGIAHIKNADGDIFCVYADAYENHDQDHLGYIISFGQTETEALENAVKCLIEKEKKQAQQIAEILNSKKNLTGERVIQEEMKAVYAVDPEFINK